MKRRSFKKLNIFINNLQHRDNMFSGYNMYRLKVPIIIISSVNYYIRSRPFIVANIKICVVMMCIAKYKRGFIFV